MTKTALLGRQLEEGIRTGRWRGGESLPSRMLLADEYGVSPGTVSLVMRSLREKGLVEIVPGKGVYVASGPVPRVAEKKPVPVLRERPLIGLAGGGLSVDLARYGADQLFSRPILGGIWAAAQAHGSPLVLLPASSDSPGFDEAYCRSLGVAGLILIGGEYYEQALRLRREGTAVILANQPAGPTPLSFVDYDNAASLRQAIDRFREAGHGRIAVVGSTGSVPGYFEAMKLHFVQALLNHTLIYDYNQYWALVDGGGSRALPQESRLEAEVQRLFSLPEPPTALYCWTPQVLAVARRVLQERGLFVPGQVSLICGGYAQASEAEVSGFLMPHLKLGQALIGHLLEQIAQAHHATQELIAAEFVDRGSIGPVVG